MAIFVAAADDSEDGHQRGEFVFGGFVAPFTYWEHAFSPAWQERVLNREPAIKYFHMTELASPGGAATHGLTEVEAGQRIAAAVDVIRSSGALRLITDHSDGEYFQDVFKDTQVVRAAKQPGTYQYEPDYPAFGRYVIAVLDHVSTEHPEARIVNFIVEQKQGVTHRMGEFYDAMPKALHSVGLEKLIPLLGTFVPGSKALAPLQAADTMLWHLRKWQCGEATRLDKQRLSQMLNGRSITHTGASRANIDGHKTRADANPAVSPFGSKRRGCA